MLITAGFHHVWDTRRRRRENAEDALSGPPQSLHWYLKRWCSHLVRQCNLERCFFAAPVKVLGFFMRMGRPDCYDSPLLVLAVVATLAVLTATLKQAQHTVTEARAVLPQALHPPTHPGNVLFSPLSSSSWPLPQSRLLRLFCSIFSTTPPPFSRNLFTFWTFTG